VTYAFWYALAAFLAVFAAIYWLSRSDKGWHIGRDLYNAGRDIIVSHGSPGNVTSDPREAIGAAESELKTNRDKILEAQEDGHYEFHFVLSGTKRESAANALSKLGHRSIKKALDSAYDACERLSRRLKSQGHRGIGEAGGDIVSVSPGDDLSGAVEKIEIALAEMNQRL
jgi:hypothetical protein